jgi:23S rRNA pseudouridine955/2504/2580 synthase
MYLADFQEYFKMSLFFTRYLIASTDHIAQRLDNFLFSQVKRLPKSCLYRLLRQGKIKVNQKRCKPSYRLQANDKVTLPTLYLDQAASPPPQPSSHLQALISQAILFENDQFLILNKPHGIAVHGGSGIRLGVIEILRQMRPVHAYLELAHRLDRDTSGCLLIAKKASILKQLHSLLRMGHMEKIYWALVDGQWPSNLIEIQRSLKKNQLYSGERIVKVDPLGKTAVTQFRILKSFSHNTLLEVQPITGRTHQIRVHAQHATYPIAGDEKYGNKTCNQSLRALGLKRLFLHAAQIRFKLSPQDPVISTSAPLPTDLQQVLKRLEKIV